MNSNKRGSVNNLTCDVCKIDFNSNADYALHEFSKKHCDNLIRLARQKPVVSKQKTKNETSSTEKEPPKVNSVTHTGSFSKYGYFVPGEIYANAETSKEFNTDYDPYLQKFAENPYKEKPNIPIPIEATAFCSITSFNKKKKKKIKTCQVCNVTLSTVPEYEAHMKSPQHIWKLKVTGMGVSAHFVKASTDLHTTDINEEPKPSNLAEESVSVGLISGNENQPAGPFPLLYCSDCELLLNSPQQYNAHIKGKSHIECAQKKAELKAKKEKLENPSPNQLYCYSCKISLNNLFQYNEHKNGKKHKTKCRNLIRKGITIPPEERVPGIPLLSPNKPVVYPELYEKLVLEKQKQNNSEAGNSVGFEDKSKENTISELPSYSLNYHSENSVDNQKNLIFNKDDGLNINSDNLEAQNENNHAVGIAENKSESLSVAKIIFHKNCANLQTDTTVSNFCNQIPEAINSENQVQNNSQKDFSIREEKKDSESQIIVITDNKPLNCSICNEVFQWQSKLDVHLATEDHVKKILELKLNGTSENEILTAIFSDRNVIKPNNSGKLTCSICNVTTDSRVEFDQHLSSIVHKYTQKDYKTKRTLEVKHMVACNEQGIYFCKLCKEGWPFLVDYIQHLHFVKHKSIQREQRAKVILAKRRNSYAQKQRLMQSFRKKNNSLRKINTEKNPGVRTKVCGVAVDLNSGTQAPIPNLETLEPKIDMTKNVSIGVCENKGSDITTPSNNNNNNNNNDNLKVSNIKKRFKTVRSDRKLQNSSPYPNDRPRFMSSGNSVPPLMPEPPFHPRFPRPNYVPSFRNLPPYSSPYLPAFEPFCGRPPMGNPYFRPPWFQRPPWPGYR